MTIRLEFFVPQAAADRLADGLSVLDDLVFDRAAAPDGGVDLASQDPSYPIQFRLYSQSQDKLDRAAALIEIIADLTGFTVPQMHSEKIAAQDWVRLTQDNLPPVHVGPFYIRGSHSPTAPEGMHDLLIDAGLAFGTGHHETTRGCLRLLCDILSVRTPRRVLDMGCGSGVLAMAAAKATPAHIIGIELDADSLDVARKNAQINGVFEHIELYHSDLPGVGGGDYDLIFANILAHPLIALAPGLTEVAQPRAHLVLAGLLIEQEAKVLTAYRNQNWQHVGGFHDGQWAMLLIEKL